MLNTLKKLTLILVLILSATFVVGCRGPYDESEIPTADDFSLAISVEGTTFAIGEEIFINAELKNLSGRGLEIAYFILFWPYIPDVFFADIARYPYPNSTYLPKGGSVQRILGLGSYLVEPLAAGLHELRISAEFTLQGEDIPPAKRNIRVVSNVISLTVNEPSEPTIPTADDFSLTISVSATTFNVGEYITMGIELKNLSGQDLIITYYGSFAMVQIPGTFYDDVIPGWGLLFQKWEAGGVIQMSEEVGRLPFMGGHKYLESGEFELFVTSTFFIGVTTSDEYRIVLTSNMINLTVLKV